MRETALAEDSRYPCESAFLEGIRFAGAFHVGGCPVPLSLVTLQSLVELKLASGISAPHRLRDLADVLGVIRTLDMDEDFADRLAHSVREKYRELWRAARSAPTDES